MECFAFIESHEPSIEIIEEQDYKLSMILSISDNDLIRFNI